MKRTFKIALVVLCVAALAFAFAPSAFAKKRVIFGGGPAGGTFQVVANGIQTYKPVKAVEEFTVKAQTSAGSTENLRKTETGKQQFSTVYSGQVWQGRNGLLPKDSKKYTNVLAVAWLYGAPAQLIVRAGSGISSVSDLAGKKVGVGNAGSGAFANCEQFFTHMGVWDKIERNAMGYNDAAAAFGNKQLDAFWLLPAFPAAPWSWPPSTNDIDMIDLAADAKLQVTLTNTPTFSKLDHSGRHLQGRGRPFPPFRTAPCGWPTPRYRRTWSTLLSKIYTPEGLAHMVNVKKTAKAMSIESGVPASLPLASGRREVLERKGHLEINSMRTRGRRFCRPFN
jgi:TRAP transporter TAXI family solute receptor